MLIVRYFLLVQLYHWTTFYKQYPWQFITGVLLFPYHIITRLTYPKPVQAQVVKASISFLKEYWESPETIAPPKFIKRRLLKLEAELD